MFRLRALSFIVALPVVLAVCYFGGWLLSAAVLFLALKALHEWRRALLLTPARLNTPVAVALIVVIILCTSLMTHEPYRLDSALVIIVAGAVAAAFIARIFTRHGGASPLLDVSTTLLSPLYLGLMFSYLIRLRSSPWAMADFSIGNLPVPIGAGILVMLFFICWGMDTGAFACGKLIGGPKLCPTISPGKTIAGFIGALVTAALVAGIGFALLHLSWWIGAIVGVVMGAIGQLGDLSKSLIKREVGIKDFGTMLPGHGGIMDRFDNFLFDAPLLFYVLVWLVGW